MKSGEEHACITPQTGEHGKGKCSKLKIENWRFEVEDSKKKQEERSQHEGSGFAAWGAQQVVGKGKTKR